jgi:hypothetical protein
MKSILDPTFRYTPSAQTDIECAGSDLRALMKQILRWAKYPES